MAAFTAAEEYRSTTVAAMSGTRFLVYSPLFLFLSTINYGRWMWKDRFSSWAARGRSRASTTNAPTLKTILRSWRTAGSCSKRPPPTETLIAAFLESHLSDNWQRIEPSVWSIVAYLPRIEYDSMDSTDSFFQATDLSSLFDIPLTSAFRWCHHR